MATMLKSIQMHNNMPRNHRGNAGSSAGGAAFGWPGAMPPGQPNRKPGPEARAWGTRSVPPPPRRMAAPCTQPRAGQKSAPNTSSPNPSGARRAIFRPGRGANERPCGPFLPCLRERGGRGRRSGGDFAKKRNGPHRPPGAQPAGEPGQDGRWGPEEGAQKPGDEIRAVFLRGTRGSRPWPGVQGRRRAPASLLGRGKKTRNPVA